MCITFRMCHNLVNCSSAYILFIDQTTMTKSLLICVGQEISVYIPGLGSAIHSQKQSAHSAVDVTSQMVPCWLGDWLIKWSLITQAIWPLNSIILFIPLPWRNSLISFRWRSTAEWASCSESVGPYSYAL